MCSKVFQRRRTVSNRGCGYGRGCKQCLQAKAVVPTKIYGERAKPSSFLTVSHSYPSVSLAVNESRSYGAICFPGDAVCFFLRARGKAGFYTSTVSLRVDVPNPRVKCNLTALLHTLASAVGLPLNARYFRGLCYIHAPTMDGCAVWEISSAHEIQISKQISAGYGR